MVEAKMKSRKGKGTPHPKGRRPLMQVEMEEDSQPDQIEHSVDHDPSKSSRHNLLQVHTQVTQTLYQIDRMVLNIHKFSSSNHLALGAVQDFGDALASIGANLQDWNDFLEAASERSSGGNLKQESCNATDHESTPVHGAKSTGLRPVSGFECGSVSCSPLVAPDVLDCDNPCSTEPLVGTPTPDRAGGSSSLSPCPKTPRMLSPPRSILVLSTISESQPLSTPNSLQYTSTPKGPTYQSQLVFETPAAQVTHHEHLNDGPFFGARTPGFGISPPRTCRPLLPEELVLTESDSGPSTPVMPSPFRAPGIVLDCENVSRECSSAGSPEIIDDLTDSAVKRLGPRGLEERLWHELAIRKADILLSVKQRCL